MTSAPRLANASRSELDHRSVRAVHADTQAGQIGAEVPDDMVEVALARRVVPLDRASPALGGVEERFDLLLLVVRELPPGRAEELDAVVLGRVVRGRDDDPQVTREQRDRRCRQHAGEQRSSPGGHDAPRQRLLERRSRRTCVAAHEDLSASAPDRGGPTQPLDEVGGQAFADHTSNTVRPEEAPRHGGRTYLFEN